MYGGALRAKSKSRQQKRISAQFPARYEQKRSKKYEACKEGEADVKQSGEESASAPLAQKVKYCIEQCDHNARIEKAKRACGL